MAAAHLDLDARKAARREAAGEPPTFTFGGQRFELPVELPLAALDGLTDLDLEGLTDEQAVGLVIPVMRTMLGAETWARFMALAPSLEDLVDVAEFMWGAYGVTPPTPSPPPRASRATTRQSKRTSKGSTGSTRATSSPAVSASAG